MKEFPRAILNFFGWVAIIVLLGLYVILVLQ